MNTMQHLDVVIAGAGVIGLSLALELRRRGRNVLVLCRENPGLASRAAAGMLAAYDPHNPAALQPLADLAHDLYPGFLHKIRTGSGLPVPIQTEHVLQADPSGQPGHTLLPTLAPTAGNFVLRSEQSLNPRDLHTALHVAAQQAGIHFKNTPDNSQPITHNRSATSHFVDCTGAWSPTHARPAKGQMLRVQLPPDSLRLPQNGNTVVRTEAIYLVPRLDGSALIGATVEDAGFDLTLRDTDLDHLRARAAALLPTAANAPELERWAGLRPRTSDDLPALGEIAPNHFVANGLFRNGILLAPAVARVMAQLLSDKAPTVPLEPFSPHRAALNSTR